MTKFLIGILLVSACSSTGGKRQSGDGEGPDDRAAASDAVVPLDAAPAVDAPLPADGAGGGDGASGNACRPACIEIVFGPCSAPKTGTCVTAGKLVCFSNGVKLVSTRLDGGAGEPFAMVTLLKPDGTMCGWYTNAVGADGNVYVVYYDPNGVEVARQQRVVPDAALGDLLITCDGQTYTVTRAQLEAPECQHVQAHDCTMGICS